MRSTSRPGSGGFARRRYRSCSGSSRRFALPGSWLGFPASSATHLPGGWAAEVCYTAGRNLMSRSASLLESTVPASRACRGKSALRSTRVPTLIALYGGTKRKQSSARFAAELARAFLSHPDVVLISGGFLRRLAKGECEGEALTFNRAKADEHRKDTSVDFAVAEAAESALRDSPREISGRFQTWLPARDTRAGVKRFR